MKKIVAYFLCAGLLLATPLASAGEVKIAYLNVKRVLNESIRAKKETQAFTKKANDYKKIIDKKQEELKAFKESLEKKAAMLSEEARREKEREYQQKVKELERTAQDFNGELKRMEKEMLDKLMANLQKVVEKFGEEGQYTLILEQTASSILYAPTAIDVTEQIIKAFDAAKE
jgi:outer membrane protein